VVSNSRHALPIASGACESGPGQQNNYEHAGRLILGLGEPPRVWMMDYRGEKEAE